jgi:hypothetical protein
MTKQLRMNAFQNSAPNIGGQEWQIYSTVLEETDSFEDIFIPSWWKHYTTGQTALRELSMVRLVAEDHSFDVFVTIRKIQPGGAVVEYLFGKLPPQHQGATSEDLSAKFVKNPEDFAVVNLDRMGKPHTRVEYLPATHWRVIGNDNEVVEKDIKSKAAADSRLEKYLYDMSLRLPSPAEQAAHVKSIADKEAEQSKVNARRAAAK